MSDSQAPAPFTAPHINDLEPLFPSYELERLIAAGGMGAVYLAVQRSLNRKVAIKILPQEFSKDASFCEGFEAEAKAMARLNHPNLIGVYDFGEVGGMLYIVMEFAPGTSVFELAHTTKLDVLHVISLIKAVCNGLAHAHENGIIHRDIKPSNILLDHNGQPKIGDFGLARPVERKIQEGEEIFGTPHYTAPEVVESPQLVDNRADIFSVGVMLHELLTGKLPADDPRPASALVQCDPRIDAVIRKATHPMVIARYATATEMVKALEGVSTTAGQRVLTTTPASAALGPGSIRRPVRPLKSTKSSSSSFFVLFIILLVGGIGYYVYDQKLLNKPAIEQQKEGVATKPEHSQPSKTQRIETPPKTEKDDPKLNVDPVVSKPPVTIQPIKPVEASKPPEAKKPQTAEPIAKAPAPPTSNFDTAEFLSKASGIMVQKAKPVFMGYDNKVALNLEEYKRALKTQVAKIDQRGMQTDAKDQLRDYMKESDHLRTVIPDKCPINVSSEWRFDDLHDGYIEKQEGYVLELKEKLNELAGTYILGIEMQIKRLEAEQDSVASKKLQEEIDHTRRDKDYFPDLMIRTRGSN